jgi:PadR family transcriptional regulator PadR
MKPIDSQYIDPLYIAKTLTRRIVLSARFQKDLLRGSLDLMVLSVLAGGKKYGYLIQKEVREASGSRVDLQAGTLYPLLHKLEDERLVRSSWDDSTGRGICQK